MGSQGTVLVIEDDDELRRILAELLTDAGYECLEAPDGEAGLRLAHESAPDLVVLDITLPGTSGIDVLHALKRHSDTWATPVIVTSALLQRLRPGDLRLATAALEKPCNLADLLAAIAWAIPRGRRARGAAVWQPSECPA